MKIFKYFSPLIMVIFLVGCGNEVESITPEKIIEDTVVVVTANAQEILADSTLWTVTERTQFRAHIGKKVIAADIKAGDLLSIETDEPIMESYPLQGVASEVVLFNDEYSLKVSSAIVSFLENQSEGDVLEFVIRSINGTTLTAEMKLWDFEDDRTFIVEIDVETKDFSVVEENGV